MRNRAILSLVFLLLLLSTQVFAANTCSSKNGGGNWSARNSWQNCRGDIPQTGDTVIINSGDTINLDVDSNSIASLSISNGATLGYVGSHTLNLAGNLSNLGTLNLGSGGTIKLQEDSSWSGSGPITAGQIDLTWNALTIPVGETMTISLSNATPIANWGSFNTASSPNTTATIYLTGGAQSVMASAFVNYPNLRIGGNGTKTVTNWGALDILGSLTIDAAAAFDVGSFNWVPVNISGNLNNAGTFGAGLGTWTFNGGSAQSISAAASFNGLTLNNPLGLTIGGNISIGATWGQLILASGQLVTNAYQVSMVQACNASPIVRQSGWINGNLTLTFPNWAVTCTFPVGSNLYAPITVAFTNSGGGTLTATTRTDTGGTMETAAGLDPTESVARYWTLTKGTLSFTGSYSATVQFNNPADLGSMANPSNFIVRHYTGGGWISPTVGTRTSTTTQATGITQTGFGDFVVGIAGTPLTCVSDAFERASLGSDWYARSVSGGFTPILVNSSGGACSGTGCRLRLTDANGGESTHISYMKQGFPFGINKVVAEFDYWRYGGSGADGIAVVFSDPNNPAGNNPPTAGAFGGSLGYAQKSNPGSDCTTAGGCPGFTGGWIGVGLDEYGNYSNPTEGRIGGPGPRPNAVAIRGAGAGQTGYAYLNGASVTTGSGNSSSAYRYRITLDSTSGGGNSALVTVERNTGSGYSTVTSYTTTAPPATLQLSFTGSTGGATNVHEIDNLQVCYQSSVDLPPPSTGTANFDVVDSYYAQGSYDAASTHHLYTKLAGWDETANSGNGAVGNTTFKVDVVALGSNGKTQTAYVASGQTKNVKLEIFDDSSGTACNSSAAACSGCSKTVVATVNPVTFAYSDAGYKNDVTVTTGDAKAYKRLIARITDTNSTPTVYGCSSDAFAVRPRSLAVTGTTSGGTALASSSGGASGTPTVKAGTDFKLTADAGVIGYDGTPAVNTANVSDFLGSSLTISSIFTGSFDAANGATGKTSGTFQYGEVGYVNLGTDAVNDSTYVAAAQDGTNGDCVANSTSNTKSTSGSTAGLYGCVVGSVATSWGRFIPDHFDFYGAMIINRSDIPTTTGTMSAGSGAVTVSSANRISAGDQLVVMGAGTGGLPLTASVNWISGSTVSLTGLAETAVTTANIYDLSVARDGFTYMDEPLLVKLTLGARNAGGTSTTNYNDDTGYTKLNAATLNGAGGANWFAAGCSGAQCFGVGAVDGTTALGGRMALNWAAAPLSRWVKGVGYFVLSLSLTRAVDGPFDNVRMGIAPIDSDGVTLAINASSSVTGSNVYNLSRIAATTTGGAVAGSTLLTVASAAGISVGDSLVIMGAGTSGEAIQLTVASISGTAVTLASAVNFTVTNTNIYDVTKIAATTTGSIAAGSSTLTVASAANISVGDSLLVLGAGGGSLWPLQAGVGTVSGTTVTLSPVDLDADRDGVNERKQILTFKERLGRLRLLNAYGSELLPIRIPVRAEYWNGAAWMLNDDNQTVFTPASVVSLGNCAGALNANQCTGGIPDAGTISLSGTPLSLVNGQANIALARPGCPAGACPTGILAITLALGNNGTTNDCVGLGDSTGGAGAPWLRGNWGAPANCNDAAAYAQDPNARVTFGTAKSRYIYLRERY